MQGDFFLLVVVKIWSCAARTDMRIGNHIIWSLLCLIAMTSWLLNWCPDHTSQPSSAQCTPWSTPNWNSSVRRGPRAAPAPQFGPALVRESWQVDRLGFRIWRGPDRRYHEPNCDQHISTSYSQIYVSKLVYYESVLHNKSNFIYFVFVNVTIFV